MVQSTLCEVMPILERTRDRAPSAQDFTCRFSQWRSRRRIHWVQMSVPPLSNPSEKIEGSA